MNSYQLSIKARYRIGILERILRVIRHRGGHITSMSMSEEGQQLLLVLQLSDATPKNLLSSQLVKLIDIIQVD